MLSRLIIQNVALIEYAELEFAEGLNVLSGETGAGKSVILDSIDFVLGAKADKSMIRYGANECSVRAEFLLADNASVKEVLQELDLEEDDLIVITRKYSIEGKSSLKLNGCAVTVSMLRRVTAFLVDVHGQSEHFFLLKESNQLRLLDRMAGAKAEECKAVVRSVLDERKDIVKALSLLGGNEEDRARKLDVLRYQIDEIERADLKVEEEGELLALREKFAHAEKIMGGLSAARDYIQADGGGADAVSGAHRALSAIAKFGDDYAALSERLENVSAELSDIGDVLDSLADGFDLDEREAERVENRLDEIKTIQKKYGGSVKETLAFLERAKEEFSLLSDSGERYLALQKELMQTDEKLYAACLALTKARKSEGEGFTRRVTEELKALNLPSARFEISFEPYTRDDVEYATREGLDKIGFLFSANAGEPLKELGKIISGGEMSRFMLAVKSQLSSVNDIGTYLFDEIDAGIGGKTAIAVAEKFLKIAIHTQIIAVSHLARIAACADREFLIEKTETDGKTFTHITALSGEACLNELARLIGGDTGEYARKHAAELLENAETYKNSLSKD